MLLKKIGELNMFEELIKKHTKEDGTIDYKAVESEYAEANKPDFSEHEEKAKALQAERDQYASKLSELEKKLLEKQEASASSNEDFKSLYENEKATREKVLGELTAKEEKYKRSMLDSALDSVIKDAGVRPEFLHFAKRDFLDSADVIEDENGNLKYVAKVGSETIDINEYVGNQLQKEQYQAILSAPANSGGGAKGSGATNALSSVANPFKKDQINLTEQARLLREDPSRYQMLEQQANAEN